MPMVMLGMNNTRMKDFFDLAVIARTSELDGDTLARALRATFERRATTTPDTDPVALTPAFATDAAKMKQWRAFLSKAGLKDQALADVAALLGDLLLLPMRAAASGARIEAVWNPAAGQWTGAS